MACKCLAAYATKDKEYAPNAMEEVLTSRMADPARNAREEGGRNVTVANVQAVVQAIVIDSSLLLLSHVLYKIC